MAGLKVWVSGGGQKYHATGVCTALTEGREKARREGRGTHDVITVNLADNVCREREPCVRCWPDSPGWSDWTAIEHRVIRLGEHPGSEYEANFLNIVLREIPGIRPADVRAQEPFSYDLREGRVDFVVEQNGVRLAIEVDGRDKSPTGRPLDAEEHARLTRRQNALTGDWRLLRFTNQQVRLNPDDCRKQVEEALALGRTGPERTVAAASVGKQTRASSQPERPQSRKGNGPPSAARESVEAPPPGGDPAPINRRGLVIGVLVVLLVAVAALAQLALATTGQDSGRRAPEGVTCPAGFPVKGNDSESGDLIYHEPGGDFYARTDPEECFADAAAANDAGYRPSAR